MGAFPIPTTCACLSSAHLFCFHHLPFVLSSVPNLPCISLGPRLPPGCRCLWPLVCWRPVICMFVKTHGAAFSLPGCLLSVLMLLEVLWQRGWDFYVRRLPHRDKQTQADSGGGANLGVGSSDRACSRAVIRGSSTPWQGKNPE